MKFTRRTAMATAVAAGVLALAGTSAFADACASRPLTIGVAYAPGAETDAIARTYAEKLSARLGQTVLIDNRPGASGTIGTSAVAKAQADGYTLLFTPSTFPIAQHVL